MDLGVASVIASSITTLGVVYVARQNKKQDAKLNDVHRQTNQNGHTSEDPTILDRLGTVEHLLRGHIEWHKEN